MSEIGMGLSNPLHGVRVPGTVGTPLPFVQCRLVDENEEEITVLAESGELRIKGPTVFKHYLNKEKATKETFDVDGWFKTGDIAIRENISDDELNEVRYRILGRSSTDIIKV
jgi:malonyl-CoA/methylmalonyl-CoA synthetase